MTIEILPVKVPGLWPITAEVGSIKVAGTTIAERIRSRFPESDRDIQIKVRGDFLPSPEFAGVLANSTGNCVVRDPADGAVVAEVILSGRSGTSELPSDTASMRIRHPWDLLALNETLMAAMDHNDIRGTIRAGATIDGFVSLGENSVILPGVYIEGNVIIGRDCKIGPNCYIRGNTSIGDRCHVGQAVEIKNRAVSP